MDQIRVGNVVRALRQRLGWRQLDLAARAGVSRSLISLVECGHLDGISLRTIRQILHVLGASVDLDVRWRGGALDHLLDERHAALVATMSSVLIRAGWAAVPEVTYARYGERGSIDLLGWHAGTRTLLVVEVKTELVSIEATLRKLDEKARLAPIVGRDRCGWTGTTVGRVVVLPASSTPRRQVDRHGRILDLALPERGPGIRSWLHRPDGPIAGILFVSCARRGGIRRARGGRRRVARPADERGAATVSVAEEVGAEPPRSSGRRAVANATDAGM
ncbi:MAG: helix-turn-helix domain-containing protein [Candidatus Limnocylindrales bacterium]